MKRWSYATAIMLSLAGGTIMTGCIDNDEPYGIEQIRLATADLLKSKKAAVEAEAAAANAAAEVEKIKAEVEKAKLEAEKAKAEAQAEIDKLLAEAEAAKTQAEADLIKAKADAIRAKAQADANYRQAQVEELIAKTQDWIKKANLAYEKLVYEWECTKVANATADNDALYASVRAYYDAYIWNLEQFNNLNEKYLMAQKKAAQWANDLVWNPKKQAFESPSYALTEYFETQVSDLEKEISYAQETVNKWTSLQAQVEKVGSTALGQLLAQYEADLTANTEALAQANIELEALYIENKALYDSRVELKKKRDELYAQEIAIPAYTYKPGSALEALGVDEEIPVVKENQAYSLNGIASSPGYNNYDNAVRDYTAEITNLTNYLLDDNDKAWTAARKKEISRELETANSEYGVAKKAWSLAKEVYNGGDKPNVANLPGEAAVDAAIAAFAAKKAVIDPLRDALVAANKKYEEAEEAADKALEVFNGTEDAAATNALAVAANNLKTARNARANAMADANEAKELAYTNARNTKETVDNNSTVAIRNAENAVVRAQAEYNLALSQSNADPTNETLKSNLKTAKDNLDLQTASRDQIKKDENKKISDAAAAYTTAINTADVAYLKAINAAKENMDKAEAAYISAVSGYDQTKDPAYAPVIAANNVVAQAIEAQETAYVNFYAEVENINALIEAIDEAVEKQEEALSFSIGETTYDWMWSPYTPIFALSLDEYTNVAAEDLASYPEAVAPIYFIVQGQYMNAKGLLMRASQIAYGNLGMRYDNGEYDFEPDYAFLVDVTPQIVTEYIAQYVKKNNVSIEPYQYITAYHRFFSYYGDTLYLENRLAVADACLAQSDLVANATKEMKDNLQALEDSKDAQEEAVRKVGEEWNAANAQIVKLEQSVNDKLADLGHVKRDLEAIISTIKDAIAEVQFGQDNEAALKNFYTACKINGETAQAIIDKKTALLEKAKYQLEQFNNGEADYSLNPYDLEVASLESEVAAAQAQLDFIKEALDVAQARYEAATKQQ